MTKTFRAFLFLFVISFLPLAKAPAAEYVTASLVSEVATAEQGSTIWLSLRLKPQKGWHFYWSNPGDSGLPVDIQWNLPEGFSEGEMLWPHPERVVEEAIMTYGYSKESEFLVPISVARDLPLAEYTLSGKATWLACEKICVPESEDLSLKIKVGPATVINKDEVVSFAQARFKIPVASQASEWKIQASKNKEWIRIQIEGEGKSLTDKDIYFFTADSKLVEHTHPQTWRFKGKKIEGWIKRSSISSVEPSALRGVLYCSRGWLGPDSQKALEIHEDYNSEILSSPSAGTKMNLPLAFLFAFLGGMILNLMPCVLPVLSVKILSFISMSGSKQKGVFLHGLAFTGGILVSFWILAGGLLLFRLGGSQLGWGFQLQSPIFVALLSLFFFGFALNLLGVFEMGYSLTTWASDVKHRETTMGSFVGGMLATVVATPCTGPFMGSAIGFALLQPSLGTFGIFTFLGLGLASPYLFLSMFPSAIASLPKPGPWMLKFKQVLSFALFATAFWLSWILSLLVGRDVIGVIIISFIMITIAAVLFGIRHQKKMIPAGLLLGATVIMLAGVPLVESFGREGVIAKKGGRISWVDYSDEARDQALREGRPIFIDFTAAWCLSCKVNEKVALSSEKVADIFTKQNVLPLMADWTHRDDKIGQTLASYGRTSIPLYVLYNELGQMKILPEVLTASRLIRDLNEHLRSGN